MPFVLSEVFINIGLTIDISNRLQWFPTRDIIHTLSHLEVLPMTCTLTSVLAWSRKVTCGTAPIPFPGEPRLALHASGRWETGGTVSLFLDNRYVDDADLPAGEWAVLALLIEAAHHARTSSATKAYRHTTELARGVAQRADLGSEEPSALF